MKKILMICLYPIAALLVVFAFLHFSYIIKYDNVDGFIIGMILLFLAIVICTIYAYISAQKKNMVYFIFCFYCGLDYIINTKSNWIY